IEVVVRRLPAVAAAAAVDHDPHGAVVDVDLHLDEVVAAADRAQLRTRLVARTRDAVRVEHAVVDRNELALADVGAHADGLRAVAQDLLDLRFREARHVLLARAADAGRDAQLDLVDPTLA